MTAAFDTNSSKESSAATLATDKALRPFLAPTFDPADFLNATLPAWTPPSSGRTYTAPASSTSTNINSLTDLNNQTQTLLSQLSAHLTRLSSQLTKLTDDILRSGGRLAYEVEILRGETGSLNDVLVDGLAEELGRFVPGGLKLLQHARRRSSTVNAESTSEEAEKAQKQAALRKQVTDPENAVDAITRLRTLALVRDRLDSVIKVFGAATEWTVPPSDVNLRSTLISVAGPEAEDTEEREKKGKAWAEKVRGEITDTAAAEGYEAALARVEQLHELATVWKGTSEEKARVKFVESMRKMVEGKKNNSNQGTGRSSTSNRNYGLR